MNLTNALYSVLGRKQKEPKDVTLARELLTLLTDRPQRVKDLAVTLNTSVMFLQQITAKLSKAKMLQVKRGPNGGVYKGV